MATVLITGANRGIGLELARCYLQRGDKVIACCRDPASAKALSELSPDLRIEAVDVASDASVTQLGERLVGVAIDITINNAGTIGPPPEQQSATQMDFDGYLSTLDTNAVGPVRVMHALAGNIRASAERKVVTITSQMGALALDMPFNYAYCASKAALNKFMKMAAEEYRKQDVAVCVIHPGWVQTDMGGPKAAITPQQSATGIVNVIDNLSLANAGSFWTWDGSVHEW